MKIFNKTTLDSVNIDDDCYVDNIDGNQSEKEKRMYDLGLTKNTIIRPLFKSMFGDTAAYLIKGSVIALRKSDAQKIHVSLWR